MDALFVGHAWAGDHHNIHLQDGQGRQLVQVRLPEGVEGIARFHALIADHAPDPADVVIATETDRGLFVGALVAAGYRVFTVNPASTASYRTRHSTSGAKSDPGDTKVLADLARTNRPLPPTPATPLGLPWAALSPGVYACDAVGLGCGWRERRE